MISIRIFSSFRIEYAPFKEGQYIKSLINIKIFNDFFFHLSFLNEFFLLLGVPASIMMKMGNNADNKNNNKEWEEKKK